MKCVHVHSVHCTVEKKARKREREREKSNEETTYKNSDDNTNGKR